MNEIHFLASRSWPVGERQHLVLGGIVAEGSRMTKLQDRLREIKAKNGLAKINLVDLSESRLPCYQEYVKAFFSSASEGSMEFTSLCVNGGSIKIDGYNEDAVEVAFSKLLYQLLMHKVGKQYGATHRIKVVLDASASKGVPSDLCEVLNANVAKLFGMSTRPFVALEVRDAEVCDVRELAELLLDAVSLRQNPDTRASKESTALARQVLDLARLTCMPYEIDGMRATTFKVWKFAYQGRPVF